MPRRKYTVNDGRLVLTLERINSTTFMVRSPLDPEIITSARSVDGAFVKAYDALKALRASRRKWAKSLRLKAAG